MKHEWRKHEKEIYLPKKGPQVVEIPSFNYFVISGQGNPNSDDFAERVQALYALSYAVKMSYKSNSVPEGYYDYTVYPLEGVWDLIDPQKGIVDKSNLKYDIMIRQPDFLTPELAEQFKALVLKKKKLSLVEEVTFKTYTEGLCVQMLHLGSYDDEPASFELMELFAKENNLERVSKIHKEIYLTDPRKTSLEKLKNDSKISGNN